MTSPSHNPTTLTSPTHKGEKVSARTAWMQYLKERFPLATYLMMSFGMSSAATILSQNQLSLVPILWGGLFILLFFAVLRLMDEVKDFRKDQIAHPERPLPRGLIKIESAKKGIRVGLALMLLLGAASGFIFAPLAGVLFIATTTYLYLMYVEFYIGDILEQFPLTYAITHQIILFPLLASVATLSPAYGQLSENLWPLLATGMQIAPAFFAYEVGRKMNPAAHPLLKNYRMSYGLSRCRLIFVALALLALAALTYGFDFTPLSDQKIFVCRILQGLSTIALLTVTFTVSDRGYKYTEIAASVNLLVAIYSPLIASLLAPWI